jgi:hypothetical protein
VVTEQAHLLPTATTEGIAAVGKLCRSVGMADPTDIAVTCAFSWPPLARYVSGARLVHGGGELPTLHGSCEAIEPA